MKLFKVKLITPRCTSYIVADTASQAIEFIEKIKHQEVLLIELIADGCSESTGLIDVRTNPFEPARHD